MSNLKDFKKQSKELVDILNKKKFIDLENELSELLPKALGYEIDIIRIYEEKENKDSCSKMHVLFSNEIIKGVKIYTVLSIGDFLEENRLIFDFTNIKAEKIDKVKSKLSSSNDLDRYLCFNKHTNSFNLDIKSSYIFYKTFIGAGYLKDE